MLLIDWYSFNIRSGDIKNVLNTSDNGTNNT